MIDRHASFSNWLFSFVANDLAPHRNPVTCILAGLDRPLVVCAQFRGFKRWTALCAATQQIAEGQLVRTAAMDAGFADTAHLTRTFRTAFGTTPTLATADRRSGQRRLRTHSLPGTMSA